MRSSFTQIKFDQPEHLTLFSSELIQSRKNSDFSADRLKEFRVQLMEQLQTTLDLHQLLAILHNALKTLMPVDGVHFVHAEKGIDIEYGAAGRHRCNYELILGQDYYGDIAFTNAQRFSEQQLSAIESIMSVVICPLANSVKYQDALASAMIDPLTGMNNRGALAVTLNREVELAKRADEASLGVIMLDIDHFKSINDEFGHLTGDGVISNVAEVIQSSVRASDACFRYGGEEFMIVLNSSNLDLASAVAERIRQAIYANVTVGEDSRAITASFGVAVFQNESDWPALVSKADKALYKAKAAGRNRVICHGNYKEEPIIA